MRGFETVLVSSSGGIQDTDVVPVPQDDMLFGPVSQVVHVPDGGAGEGNTTG